MPWEILTSEVGNEAALCMLTCANRHPVRLPITPIYCVLISWEYHAQSPEHIFFSHLVLCIFNLICTGLHRSAKKEDMTKHRIQTAERLLKLCDELSKEVHFSTIKMLIET